MATKVAVNPSLQERKEKKKITSSRLSSGISKPGTARTTTSASPRIPTSRVKKNDEVAEKKKALEEKKSAEKRTVEEKKRPDTGKKSGTKASPVISSRVPSRPTTKAGVAAMSKSKDATDGPKVLSSSRIGSGTAASKRTGASSSATPKPITNGTVSGLSKASKPSATKTAPSTVGAATRSPTKTSESKTSAGPLSSKSASAVSKTTPKLATAGRSPATRPQSARTATTSVSTKTSAPSTADSKIAVTKTSAPSTADSKTAATKPARPVSTRAGAATSSRIAAKPKVTADSATKTGKATAGVSPKPVASRTSAASKVTSSMRTPPVTKTGTGTASKPLGTKKLVSGPKSSTPKPSSVVAGTSARKPVTGGAKVTTKTPSKPSPARSGASAKSITSPTKKAVTKPLAKKGDTGKKVDVKAPKAKEPTAEVTIEVEPVVLPPAPSATEQVEEKTDVDVTVSTVADADASSPSVGEGASLAADQPAALPPDTAQRVGQIISSQTSLSKELQSKLPRVGDLFEEAAETVAQPSEQKDVPPELVVLTGEEVQLKTEAEPVTDVSVDLSITRQEEEDMKRQQEEEREERRKRVDEILERTRPKEDVLEDEVSQVKDEEEQVEVVVEDKKEAEQAQEEVEEVREDAKEEEEAEVKEAVGQIQVEVEQLQGDVSVGAKDEVEELKEDDMKARVEHVEVEQTQEEVEQKEEVVEQTQEDVEMKQEEVEQKQEEVEQKQEEVEQKQEEVEQKQEEVEQQLEEVEQMQEEVEQKQEEVEQMREEVGQVREEVEEIEKNIEEVREEVEQVKEEVKDEIEEVKEVIGEVGHEQEVEPVQVETEPVQEEVEQLEEQVTEVVEELKEEVKQVEEEVEQEEKDVEQVEEEPEQVEEEVEQVQKEVEQVEEEVGQGILDHSLVDVGANVSSTEDVTYNRGTISAQDSFEFKLAYEPQELQTTAMVDVAEEGDGNEKWNEDVVLTTASNQDDVVQFARSDSVAAEEVLVGEAQVEGVVKDEGREEEQPTESKEEVLEGVEHGLPEPQNAVEVQSQERTGEGVVETQEAEDDGIGLENDGIDEGVVVNEALDEDVLNLDVDAEDMAGGKEDVVSFQEKEEASEVDLEGFSAAEVAIQEKYSEDLEEELGLEKSREDSTPVLDEVENVPDVQDVDSSMKDEEDMGEGFNLDEGEGKVVDKEKEVSVDQEDVEVPHESVEAVPQMEEAAAVEESKEAEGELVEMAESEESPSSTTPVLDEVEYSQEGCVDEEAELGASLVALDAQVEQELAGEVLEPVEASFGDPSKLLDLDNAISQETGEAEVEGDQNFGSDDLLQEEEDLQEGSQLGGAYVSPLIPELMGAEEELTVGDRLEYRSSGRSESGSGGEQADTPVLPALGGSASSSPIVGLQEEDTQNGGKCELQEEDVPKEEALVDFVDDHSPDIADVTPGMADQGTAEVISHEEHLVDVSEFLAEEDLTIGDKFMTGGDGGNFEVEGGSGSPDLVTFESSGADSGSSEPLLPGLTDSSELTSGIVDVTSAPQDLLTNPFSTSPSAMETSDPFGFKLEEESGTYPQSTAEAPSDPFFNLEEPVAGKASPDPFPVSSTLTTDDNTGGSLLTFEGDSSI